jgi:putative oxidoreductase
VRNYSTLQQYGIAILRIIVGIIFIMHGSQKLFTYGYQGVVGSMGQMGIPAPEVAAVLIMATEFIGGILLLLGLFTRLAAIPIAFAMLVAIVQVHLKNGFFAGGGGYEFPLTLAVAAIALVLTGSGAWAIDNVLGTDSKLFGRRRLVEVRRAA